MAYVSPLESRSAQSFGAFFVGIILLGRLFSRVTGISLQTSSFLGFIGAILAIVVVSASGTWLVLRLFPEAE